MFVSEGDTVTKGQLLIQLDDHDLELAVAGAQAELDSAEARLLQVRNGNATPAELAGAQAVVRNAQAQVDKTHTGNVTPADIDEASAAVVAAQSSLEETRNTLSAAKTQAEQHLAQTTQTLVQAQADYSQAYWNNQFVEDTGNDPFQTEAQLPNGEVVDNDLSEPSELLYETQLQQAEAALRSAEQAIAQAQVSYDNAQQAETTGIQQAEQQVAQAQAQLTRLQQGGTEADIRAAQANLDQSEASLAQLTEPATATELDIQRAAVAQAEVALEQAKTNHARTKLLAPFNGIVTEIAITSGDIITTGMPVIELINRDPLQVDFRLNESDVAQIEMGQPVTITVDALPGWERVGTLTHIAPAADIVNDVVTFDVQASFSDVDEQIKVGMTASLTIITDQKDDVLLIPNTAILPSGAQQVVWVVDTDGQMRERPIEIGLTDGINTEIVRGLQPGDHIVSVPFNDPVDDVQLLNFDQ